MIASSKQFQIEIKEENTEEQELTEGSLQEQGLHYLFKRHADNVVIKKEDVPLNDLEDNQDRVQITYNDKCFKEQSVVLETESIIVKGEPQVKFEYTCDSELFIDEQILTVPPHLSTLPSQLDYNLKIRGFTKSCNDPVGHNFQSNNARKQTISKKTCIYHNKQNKSEVPEVSTVQSYRYAIHNKKVNNQVEKDDFDYTEEQVEIITSSVRRNANKRKRNVKKHKCDLCGLFLQTKTRLQTHLMRHDREVEPYVCYICAKQFKQKSGIVNHVTRAHSKNKDPYKCEMCDIRFDSYQIFYMHLRSHIGLLFKCDICNKQFCRKGSYRSHMCKHHIS